MLRGQGGWSRRSAGGRGRATPSQWVVGGPGRAIPLQGGATRTGSFASDAPIHGAGNSLSAGASATAHGLQVGWSKADHSGDLGNTYGNCYEVTSNATSHPQR